MAATKAKVSERNGAAVPEIGITIPEPRIETIHVPIVGTTPLVVHAWGQKAKRLMLDKQQKKAKAPREVKNPEQDYRDSRYISDEGWDGVPAAGFKSALVGACRAVDDLPMTLAKRMCFVLADGRSTKQNVELVRIIGEPRMREDMVRLESGVADIRYRAEYVEWSATLRIEFNAGVISAEQIVNLCDLAGYSEGCCEWRPSSPKSASGSCGRWRVKR